MNPVSSFRVIETWLCERRYISPRTPSRCGNPRKCRPCCPVNFFLRLANGTPSPPPPDAPACVLRLTGHGLRCLQRFHEKHGLHSMTFQSQEACCRMPNCLPRLLHCMRFTSLWYTLTTFWIHIVVCCKSNVVGTTVEREGRWLQTAAFQSLPADRGISDASARDATRALTRLRLEHAGPTLSLSTICRWKVFAEMWCVMVCVGGLLRIVTN